MGGGAWPFLVGGVICHVNSDNERDGSWGLMWVRRILMCMISQDSARKSKEATRNNRSVMPFDALGGTRATLWGVEREWVERPA